MKLKPEADFRTAAEFNAQAGRKHTSFACGDVTSDGIEIAPEDVNQFAQVAPNVYSPAPKTIKPLPAGMYSVDQDWNGNIYYSKMKDVSDEIITFEDDLSAQLISEAKKFWEKGEDFERFGFLHKRGILMYGPQGSGKTMTVRTIAQGVVNQGGVAFFCENPRALNAGLKSFRNAQPDTPVVAIFEDIDSIMSYYGQDSLLSLLDGENQVDKVLNIATTNYIEVLPPRIIGRPRRFDTVKFVDMPEARVRRVFFARKLKEDENSAKVMMYTSKSEGFSFAAMSDLIISVEVLGFSVDETVKKLRIMLSLDAIDG